MISEYEYEYVHKLLIKQQRGVVTAGPDYIRFFISLLAHKEPHFKHIEDKNYIIQQDSKITKLHFAKCVYFSLI